MARVTRYRNKIMIYAVILKHLSEKGSTPYSRLAYVANLGVKFFDRYMKVLINTDLVQVTEIDSERRRKYYNNNVGGGTKRVVGITPKGMRFLEKYEAMPEIDVFKRRDPKTIGFET